MAKQVTKLPGIDHHGKYDWDKWFNGKPWRLDRGTDFEVTAYAFRETVFAMAMYRGLKVTTRKPNKDTLFIQVTGESEY